MPYGIITGQPRIGSRNNTAHRIVFKGGWMEANMPGGKLISGAASRDPGNSPEVYVLRAGTVMGKITTVVNSLGTVGHYAPSIIGVTTNAEAAGSTAVEASAAVVTELVRRRGATGTFHLVGPPTAAGTVVDELVTYSAASGTTITVTATTAAFVAGSLIMPTDGSQDAVTFIPDGWGVLVVDTMDLTTNLPVPFDFFPLGGVLLSSQLINWPADASTRTWLIGKLSRDGYGKFVFDNQY